MIIKNVFIPSENKICDIDFEQKINRIGVIDGNGLDADGCSLVYGFIDTHIHGCNGVEFSAPNEDFSKATHWLAERGTTSYAATVRCLPEERIIPAIKNIKREAEKSNAIVGINLEGPFVSAKHIGAMTAANISKPDVDMTKRFIDTADGYLKFMTVAPENDGALDVIRYASDNGVSVSLGHTGASYEQAQAAIESGANRITHVFNAMRPFLHRDPGIPGAALTDKRLTCEVICDYMHLNPVTVSLVLKQKGFRMVNMISDMGAMSGLGDGTYNVDGRIRIVKNGLCYTDNGTIAGSTKSIYDGVVNLFKSGYSLADISIAASYEPAKALGISHRKGKIKVGYDADLVLLDKDCKIKKVFVNGAELN